MTEREGTAEDFAQMLGAAAAGTDVPHPGEAEPTHEELEKLATGQPDQPVVEEEQAGEPAGRSDEQVFIEQLFRRKPGHVELVRRLHGGAGE